MTLDDEFLSERLDDLAARLPDRRDALDTLATFIRTADDRELVRINPISFAREQGCDEAAVIDLFLHARKIGLLHMEWHYVCPGCGDIVESFQSLTSATAHYFCQVCTANRDADLSDFVEITFSVSRKVRESSYHDPWSLSPEEYFFSYRFTGNGVLTDGTPLREHLRRTAAVCAFLESGEMRTFDCVANPGFLWFTNGPALTVSDDRTEETQWFAFEYSGPRTESFRHEVASGPVTFDFTNATDHRYALLVVNLPGDYLWRMGPFLSASQLLSNQTFLDLFASETIVAAEGLEVRRLTLLFTDIQGSTAMYERVGDMKAFDVVRLHFGFLRESISQNAGALREDDRRCRDGELPRSTRCAPCCPRHARADRRFQHRRRGRADHVESGSAYGNLPGGDAEQSLGLLRPDGESRSPGAGALGRQRHRAHGRDAQSCRCAGASRRLRTRRASSRAEGYSGSRSDPSRFGDGGA